jgi:lambda family phage minor tail protein L
MVDNSFLGGTKYYFHDGTNNNYQPLIFDSIEYQPYPFKLEGFEIDGKGSLPRPKITLANLNGLLSSIIIGNDTLIGAIFSRKRVFARFIDAANFPNNVNPFGTPDATAAYPDEVFFVNRKIIENNEVVQYELVTTLEIDNVKLPKRQIFSNICQFEYRDESCGYSGVPSADRNGKVFGAGGYNLTLNNAGEYNPNLFYAPGDYVFITSTLPLTEGNKIYFVYTGNSYYVTGIENSPMRSSLWVADSCARHCRACKLRFPAPLALRFGGFPGTTKAPLVF